MSETEKDNVDNQIDHQEDNTTDDDESSAVDVAKELELLKKELQLERDKNKSLAAKKDELLDEKKKADKAKRDAEDRLKLEEEEKARKSGDWEKLVKAAEEKAKTAEQKLQELYQAQIDKEIKSQAYKIASEMRGRPESIEILADCVFKEIKGLVDDNGQLSETNKTRIIENMSEQAKYKPLLMQNQSTGGGAQGGGGGASKSLKDMTEQEQVDLFRKNPEKWRQLKAVDGNN